MKQNTHRFPKFLLGLFLTLFSVSPISAENSHFCSDYARQSVLQHIHNLKGSCHLNGDHWSPLLRKQQNWCLEHDTSLVTHTLQTRTQQLKQCGHRSMQRALDWKELPYRTKNNLMAAVIHATQVDDIASVRLFEAQGVDLDFEWQMTQGGLLYWAISHQAPQVCHYLIEEKQADPTLSRNGGPNPLVNLLNNTPNVNYRLLRYLLQKGAMPNHGGEDFSEVSLPLPVATANNDLQAVSILLEHQADPNLFEVIPPLMIAIDQNNARLVDVLLTAGADPNMGFSHLNCKKIHHEQLEGEYLPLDRARQNNNPRIIKLLNEAGAVSSEQCVLKH